MTYNTDEMEGLPDWDDPCQEIAHLDGVVSLRVEEIQPILLFVDVVCVPTPISHDSDSWTNGYAVTYLWALCFRINCSNHKNVLLCVTFCLTCTLAFQVFFAASLVHAGH